MLRSSFVAACLSFLPVAAVAGSLSASEPHPFAIAPAPATSEPDVIFTLRGGGAVTPEYFGSDEFRFGPEIGFSLNYLRLPGGYSFGSTDPDFVRTGLAPHASFRYIRERTSSDSPELDGLDDVDTSVELGLGLSYGQRHYRVFADARYGVIGHNAWVGELGADMIIYPTDRAKLWLGPRVFLGSDDYSATYFGVTAAEAAASGLSAFAAEGGVVSAGLEVGMTYQLNDRWGVEGVITYDRLLNDAADSPITALGSEDQVGLRIGLTRRITLDF
jgi:outer membrane protein